MTTPDFPLPCSHADGFGSTIIFVQDRPQDGICMLCDERFPMLTVVPPPATSPTEPGRCLRHGHVTERCCKGWEPLPRTTFLRDALATSRGDRG